MRRERYPQTQNRMVYKDKDHREIIMDDNYHGAVYIDDDMFPAWRKYKPRSIFVNYRDFSYKSSAMQGALFSIDTENKYFSMFPSYYFDVSNYFVFGNIYYMNFHMGGKNWGLASINGYDWKKYEVSVFLNRSDYIGNYGDYIIFRNNDYYYVYKITYNSENYTFSEPTLVTQVGAYDYGEYLGQVSNDLYKGAIFYRGTSIRANEINLVTGDNFDVQNIITFDNSGLTKAVVLKMLYVNNQYMIFIRYYIDSAPQSSLSYQTYHKITVLCSDSCSPDSWHEETIRPQELDSYTIDNDQNRITCYWQSDNTSTSTVLHVTYINSKYYVYLYHTYAYNSWQNYYIEWRQGRRVKVITGGGRDVMFSYVTVYCSEDLINWTNYTLPTYLDIPFFNSEDILVGRHGNGIMQCNYNGVRFFLDGKELQRSLSSYYPFPSGVISNQPYLSEGDNYRPDPFNGMLSSNSQYDNIRPFEAINGEVQPTGNSDMNDIWISRTISIPEDEHHIYYYGIYVCINFKNPLFGYDPDNYVYLLNNNHGDWGNKNPSYYYNNVDPISQEDYIFD